MKKLLYIIATPRHDESMTLKVSKAFLEAFSKKYLECKIDELNLYTEKLPSLTVEAVAGKYVLLGGKDLTDKLKAAWVPIVQHIERFLSADAYLITRSE